MRKVILNSTPIIALRAIGHMDILRRLYGTVIIPAAVLREVTAKDSHALDEYPWIIMKTIRNVAARDVFTTALHDGEVEVMLLAKEVGADLIVMDDNLARRHAKYLGLRVTGTIGVLLRAKREGIVDMIEPILDCLIANSFFISGSVRHEILRLAGEL